MEPGQNICPFDEDSRASRCESCCDENAVPPCAKGWFKSRYATAAPQPIGLAVWEKKAA
jgi:hypothetical protein